MNKKEVARVLEDIAVLLELSGENPFKARSYENVARALEQHEDGIETLVQEKRLREVKGVGDALEQKITELVSTGRLEYYEELRAKFPETLFELFVIPGLGAKRIRAVYDELKVHSLSGLERACKDGRVAALKGFGVKTQDKILEGIAFARKRRGLFRVDVAWTEAARLRDWVAGSDAVERIELAGSLRRRKEVVKDIDLVASSKEPSKLMERFVAYEGVESVTGHGETKSSVVLRSGIAADLRVVSDEQFPYALHHFTGSKEHNVAMRQRAKELDLKMNEYGLFRGEENVPCGDEAAIFRELGLPFIPPELREDTGELELRATPRLLERNDLAGLIHCHSTYSDGRATLKQMAEAAQERGYAYMVIADHSQTAVYAGGLRPESVLKQHTEIEALNASSKAFRILKCIESDILLDGALDYDED
ncbi:MAG: helix-hairpin-helix domain-containing protein, partial [Candidatus Hydrogenedentales bacterium]